MVCMTSFECNYLLMEMAVGTVSIIAPKLAELKMNNTSSLRYIVINFIYRHCNGLDTVESIFT